MRLQFSWGASRFVVLVGPVAIKIARPRFFRPLKRFVEHLINGEVRARLLTFAENPFLAGIRYIFWGVIANRTEYQLWHVSPRRFMVPTFYSFGWIINIQGRGESISQEELDAAHPFPTLLAARD